MSLYDRIPLLQLSSHPFECLAAAMATAMMMIITRWRPRRKWTTTECSDSAETHGHVFHSPTARNFLCCPRLCVYSPRVISGKPTRYNGTAVFQVQGQRMSRGNHPNVSFTFLVRVYVALLVVAAAITRLVLFPHLTNKCAIKWRPTTSKKKKKSPKIFQSSDCGLVRPRNSTKKKSSFRPEISATFFKSSESNGTITRPSDQHIHPVTGVPADPAGNNSTTAKISFFRPFNYDFTSLFAVSWMMCAQTGTFGAPGSIFNSGDGMHVTLCFSWQAKMTCAYLNRITKWHLIISSTKRQRDRLQGSTPGFTLFLFTRWPVDIAPPQRCSYFTSFRLWLGGNLATHFGRSSSIRSPFRLPGSLFSCLFVSSHWHYLQVHRLPSTEY